MNKRKQDNNLKSIKIWLIVLAILGFTIFQPFFGAVFFEGERFSEAAVMAYLFLGSQMRIAAVILLFVYIAKKRKKKNNFVNIQKRVKEVVSRDDALKKNCPELFNEDIYFSRNLSNYQSDRVSENTKKHDENLLSELSNYEKKSIYMKKIAGILKEYLQQKDFHVIFTYKKEDDYYEYELYLVKQNNWFKFILNTKYKADYSSLEMQTKEKEIEHNYCDKHSLNDFIAYMKLHLMISWFDEIGADTYKIITENEY